MAEDGTPPVVVTLPGTLLRLFPTAPARVELRAATVAELVAALEARWPGMRDRLCDSGPRLRRNINVFVSGRRATLATCLDPGAQVAIMTGITG